MTIQKELIPKLPGDVLRYHRDRLGLTLEQASEQSRIKLGTLMAIESGDTENIPSVYLRGYIRNYARFLGVPGDELEDQIQNARGADPAIQSVFSAEGRRGRGESWLKASSYLVASALIVALAWQFTHEAVRFSQGESQLMTGNPEAPDGSPQARTEPAADTLPAGTHLNASIASVELLRQRSQLSGETTAKQAWGAIGGPGEPAASASPANHHLELTASGDCWVEIIGGDGTQLEQDLIRAGNSRAYDDEGPFQVMIGRASSVVLTLNGEAVDLGPHSQGDVARLTLGADPMAEAGAAAADSERR